MNRTAEWLAAQVKRTGYRVAGSFGGQAAEPTISTPDAPIGNDGVRDAASPLRAGANVRHLSTAKADAATRDGKPRQRTQRVADLPCASQGDATIGAGVPRRGSSSAGAPLYEIVLLCRAHRLPEPIPEYQFHQTRKWRFDYAWPLHMLALEVEGGIWTQGRHTRGKGALADMEKYSEAAVHGWRLLYVTPEQARGPAMDLIRRALKGNIAA